MVRSMLTAAVLVLLGTQAMRAQTGGEEEGGVGDTRAFEVNDIQVILSPADNEIVSIIVGFDGGYVGGLTTNPILPEITASVIAGGG